VLARQQKSKVDPESEATVDGTQPLDVLVSCFRNVESKQQEKKEE